MLEHRGEFADEGDEIEVGGREFHATGVDFREVEDFVDEAQEMIGAAGDGREGVALEGVQRAVAEVDLRVAEDVMPGLTAHEDAAHRPGIADGSRAPGADFFCRRQIGQIVAMAFASVEHLQAGGPPPGQQLHVRFDRASELRNVVAEHFPKAARIEEIALHVDDEESALRGLEGEFIRLGVDAEFGNHCPRL